MKRSQTASRILLADDDVAYGSALAELLENDGHLVRHVPDGEEAILALRMDGWRYRLVLTDLLMPRKTGFDVVREVRDLGLGIPVLAMTSLYDHVDEIHSLKALGVAGWIHKSAPFEHVLFRVNSALWPSTANMRQSTRVAVSLPVQFRAGGRVFYATSYNLSATGVYVRTPDLVPDGAIIDIAIALPTAGEMLTMRAEVMHSASVDDVRGTAYPAGFGARFLDPAAVTAAALRRFVDGLAAEEGTPVAPAREAAAEPVACEATAGAGAGGASRSC